MRRVKSGLNKTTKCLKSMKRVCVTLSVGSVCFINLTSKSKLRNANSEFSYSLAAISSSRNFKKIGGALISAGDGVQTFAGSLNLFPSREGVLSTKHLIRKNTGSLLHGSFLRLAIYTWIIVTIKIIRSKDQNVDYWICQNYHAINVFHSF